MYIVVYSFEIDVVVTSLLENHLKVFIWGREEVCDRQTQKIYGPTPPLTSGRRAVGQRCALDTSEALGSKSSVVG